MPSTVVHFALGLLVGAALLRGRFDRTAVLVVAAAVVVPDLDTFVSLALDSAHRAVLHTVLVPALVGVAVYYDAWVRETPLLRERFGDRAVTLAWTWATVYAVAGIGLDFVTVQGANLFYPAYDQFFEFQGEVYLATDEGFVQTFVEVTRESPSNGGGGGVDVDPGGIGSTENVTVDSGVNPTDEDPDDGPPNRVFPIAFRGWQLALCVTGVTVAVARRRVDDLLGR
jgi:hypothetical protein